ncbi:putative T7SS-secreted protein [Streptomyces sparsus]
MGIGDLLGPAGDWIDKGQEKVGGLVEDAGDWTADRAEDVGWDSGADWIRDKSKSTANRLGADVAELQLGQTEEPKKLVHGSPSKLRATAGHLDDLKTSFNSVGTGLKSLDSSRLKGQAADAFREKVSVEPKKWFKAADACEKAAGALRDFAGTVEWAQGRAKEALAKYNRGVKASEAARTAHNEAVDTYNDAVDKYNGTAADKRDPADLPRKPGAFKDPGTADIEAAEQMLAEARTQRDSAQRTAAATLRAARDEAPPKPSYAEQVEDGVVGLKLDADHVGGGLLKGTASIVSFARSMNMLDPYNLTHPAEYATNLNSTATGLVQLAKDPMPALQGAWEAFDRDRSEGIGRIAPELIGPKGAGLPRRLAKTPGDVPTGAGRRDLDRNGGETHAKRDDNRSTQGTDPVDLATGRMFLPQTDVALPGALPLSFVRRVESGYRSGRWFGPSWSSTADQRLEVDAKGVVFVSEDGRLLAFPHPAPGVPTEPTHGSRMLLERTDQGDYTLTDPETGVVRLFAGPQSGADGAALLEGLYDRNGNTVSFEYAADGTPLAVAHSGGYRLRVTTAEGRITALHLAGAAPDGGDQELVRYGYTDGDLTSVTNSSGLPLRFEYDDEQRVIAWTDTNHRRYDYVYDNNDRCIAEGGTEGHLAVRLAYDERDDRTGHRVTTLTTASGHSTRHLIDEHGNVVAVTDPLGHTTRTRQDRRGRPLERTDALGRTTHYTWDEQGHLTRATRPDGRSVTFDVNALGLPEAVTDVEGRRWQYTYDERGNRVTATDPAGSVTRYAHDGSGNLTSVTDPLGAVTRVRCDAAGLPVEITDPLGGVTGYERDRFGRVTTITDPTGAATHLSWNVEGKPLSRTAPDGTRERWTYDGEGNCLTHTDQHGGTTTFEYTHFDQLAARTGPDGVRYTFDHDAELRLTRVTDPQGLTWDYTYDPSGRLTAESDFDDRTLTYEHDPVGRLTARTNPLGQTVTLTHGLLDEVQRTDADGAVTTYTYDIAGRLLGAANNDGELVHHRDRAGRLKAETSNGRTTSFGYDPLGRRTRRVTPMGAVTTYTHDAAGRRTGMTVAGRRVDFSLDAVGRHTGRRIGTGLALDQQWDPAGRLTEQTALGGPDAHLLTRRTYHWRADGYLTGIDDTGESAGTGSRRFTLDPAGRVTAVHADGWTESYAYDEAGNQAHATWPDTHPGTEATGPRTYTGTRITGAGRVRYTYDAAGRLTRRTRTRLSRKPDTWHYTYDAHDRLTHVTTPDGTRWRYRYDPLGRRTAKQRLGGDDGETVVEEVQFTWDGATLVEQTTTGPDLPHPVTLTWDHHGLHPLTQTERLTDATTQAEIDSRFFAIVTDLVGTPTHLVDETGRTAWHTRTTLWGATTWNRDATAHTPLRFPGQYHDPETGGLHYNHFRHYDPETARYTTPDPLGLAPAPNPATYVHNPLTWTDPLGLAPDCEEWRRGPEGPANSANGERLKEQLREEAGPVGSIQGIEDIMDSPQILAGGVKPEEVRGALVYAPGWREETLGRGGHAGQGWVLREYNDRGDPTGRMLRWHPGGGHHGSAPYWRVKGYEGDLGGVLH